MNAGVGPSGYRGIDGAAEDKGQGFFEDSLDGDKPRLLGPTCEGATVVGKIKTHAYAGLV